MMKYLQFRVCILSAACLALYSGVILVVKFWTYHCNIYMFMFPYKNLNTSGLDWL